MDLTPQEDFSPEGDVLRRADVVVASSPPVNLKEVKA